MKCVMLQTNRSSILSFLNLTSDQALLIVLGASIAVVVPIVVIVGLVIWWVLKRRNSRKENTKGDCSILEFYKSHFFLVSALELEQEKVYKIDAKRTIPYVWLL